MTFIQRLFPITTGEWWYMSVYFATVLISPILNKAVDTFSKRESVSFLCAMLLTCSLLPFFTKFKEPLGVNLGYSFIWFIVLYYTGAVLCKYFKDYKSKYFLVIFFAMAVLTILVGNIASKFVFLRGYGLSCYNSIVLYLQAIVIFLWFKNLKISGTRIKNLITNISGLSLAAYVFHCQKDIAPLLWERLQPSQYADSIMLIPVYIVTVLSIFAIAILIEKARKIIFSISGFENNISGRITTSIKNIGEGVFTLIDKIGK